MASFSKLPQETSQHEKTGIAGFEIGGQGFFSELPILNGVFSKTDNCFLFLRA
jgi:hypothetical protein